MSLAPGSRIGHYDIVAAIGAGGMGEVYRARDTQLDRDIALKILPESFAADPDRMMRFTREAKTLASLNHPNIAHIHGLQEASGVRALVMELVEGEDLSQRIARGSLSLDDALPLARQIAEALEAAHEQGIVHRDLKPANIKVRSDGTVKVLDFGLAKAMDVTSGGQTSNTATSSPTMTSPALTAMGLILGTAAYMSPEQARGRPVDKRADIWAFGVVLYEMLGGTQLFQGETVSDVIAAVLRADIDLAALPPTVPTGLRQLLKRCLEKDPRKRLRDIGEARLILDAPDAATEQQTVISPTLSSASGIWPWVAAGTSLAAVAMAGWMLLSPVPPQDPIRASIQLPPGTEYAIDSSNPPNLAISPDGSTIVFAATARGAPPTASTLYVRRLDQPAAVAIPDTGTGRVPFFSPDSRQVGFLAGSVMKKVSLSGGAPSVITSGISNVWGGTWLPDGTIVFANPQPTGDMLYSVSDQGGTAELLSRVERLDNDNSFPRALDADDLLVTMWTGGLYTDGKIFKYSRQERKITTQLVEGGGQGHLLGGRHLVYARGSELLAQPYPGGAGQSGAVKMLDGVLTDSSYATAQFDVSRSGALVYAPAPAQAPTATVVWVSENGGQVDTLFDDPNIEFPRLSADGRQLVYSSTQTTREKDLWVFDLVARRRARLTNTSGEEYSPVVSKDGARVFFSAWRDTAGLYQTSIRGSLESRLIIPEARAIRGWSLSADERWLVVTDDVPGGAFDRSGADIGVIDLTATPLALRWLTSTPFREDQAAFSPDGSHIAYTANPLGQTDIWVLPFSADGASPIPVSREGGSMPFWSSDGRTLYYSDDDSVMAVAVARGPSIAFSEPRVVFTVPNLTVIGVAPDGRFLAIERVREPVTRLEIIVNWIEDLKRRVR